MQVLSPITAPSKAELGDALNPATSQWFKGQDKTYVSRIPNAEREAYAVSDQITPQYVYQDCSSDQFAAHQF
jgi:hypothetical protein